MRRLVKPEKISHNGAVNKRRGKKTPPLIFDNQAPSANDQIMTKFSISNFGFWGIGIWSLFGICDLVIGILKAWIKILLRW